MIMHLFRRTPRAASIASFYGMIVAQARAPVFYQDYGVPDTVNGRFEMVVLHAVMVLDRLTAGPEPLRAVGQAIFDLFCRDMDANLREMGVGDLAVPRTMRKIGEAFYGRQGAYRAALAAPDRQALTEVLARNVFAGASGAAPGADRLAAYMREAVGHLAAQDATALSRAELGFPDPARIAAPDFAAAGHGER
ncbi:MAG: cytochrome b pre-mRNA-processing protein 3 [Alphaproteobacteria bacterium]|nr:cytochrome b pre-mRNA-processing protein 3 [Alphaproteobacteria bacterium]